jgi:hypothetical protein
MRDKTALRSTVGTIAEMGRIVGIENARPAVSGEQRGNNELDKVHIFEHSVLQHTLAAVS